LRRTLVANESLTKSYQAMTPFLSLTRQQGGRKSGRGMFFHATFMVQQIPRARIGQRIQNFKVVAFPYTTLLGIAPTQWLAFPCCLCAQTFGKITESAILLYLPLVLIVDFGLHRARKTCASIFGECGYHRSYFDNSRLIDGNSTTRGFFTKEGILEKEYPSRSKYQIVIKPDA